MKDLIQKTIAQLRQQVKQNLDVINGNQAKIKDLLARPVSSARSDIFEKHYGENRDLLSENNDFIQVQLTLINFIEKYKQAGFLNETPAEPAENPINETKIFESTVEGSLLYNEQHPYFSQTPFYNKLMDYFLKHEQYEKCEELSRLRSRQGCS